MSPDLEPADGLDHVRGDPDAPLTIIEYGDYDCPHTRAAQASLDQLLEENPDVRFVFRHFPLRQLHANAEKLARVAEAAELQEKFWPMHDRLMHGRFPIDDAELAADAARAGVDLERVDEAIDDEEIVEKIQHDVLRGRRAGVHSTPTFFIDGELHDQGYDLDTLRAKVEMARRRARLDTTRHGSR